MCAPPPENTGLEEAESRLTTSTRRRGRAELVGRECDVLNRRRDVLDIKIAWTIRSAISECTRVKTKECQGNPWVKLRVHGANDGVKHNGGDGE
jgi:hypothetical protein